MERVLYFPSLTSTNAYAKQHAQSLPDKTIIVADEQTAGRGRFDRKWVSAPGGLYFSVLMKPTDVTNLPNLTQLMALCICQTVRKLGAEAILKWPNDVLVDGKKISGILSEVILRENTFYALVIGVGINAEQENLSGVGQPAVSLRELGIRLEKQELLQDVLERFWPRCAAVLKEGFSAFGKEYKELFPYLGKTISVTNGGRKISGAVQDISPTGTLLLATTLGRREFSIGDINA